MVFPDGVILTFNKDSFNWMLINVDREMPLHLHPKRLEGIIYGQDLEAKVMFCRRTVASCSPARKKSHKLFLKFDRMVKVIWKTGVTLRSVGKTSNVN